MHIKNYQEAVDALYPYLEEYLNQNGIDTSKNFNCINPDHDDTSPSMGIVPPDRKTFNCFGCGAVGGIFNAVYYLEGKPAHGPGFVQDNLLYLAQKFGIELEHEELTEEQLYELDTYRAYRIASEVITSGPRTELFNKTIKNRAWTEDTCNQYGVGCVSGHKVFKETLKKAGFSAGFLGDVDIDRKDIFGDDRLIFTIRDEHGRPVGFASRNLNFTKDKKNGAKYVNQRGTGVKCNIYRKSERLFGFDQVLKKRGKGQDPIYIFEGYSDVVTAAQHGIWNACALGGTALTQEHVQLLKYNNCYDIVLCLDGDTPGQKRTAEILDERLGSHKDLSISIINLPEGLDPDEYIQQHGVTKFKELEKWSAFEWRLQRWEDNENVELICKSMIPLIVNESSYIAQEKMAHTLSKNTGITLRAIQQELGRLQNKREAEKDKERSLIIDKLKFNLKKDPTAAEYALQEANTNLFDLSKKYSTDAFSEESTLSIINENKKAQESLDGKFTGFILGPDMDEMQKALCGNWKKDVWICIGGRPNSGKTSFLSKLLFQIAKYEEENNACVIYHTIDDTTEQVLPKFICVANGTRKLTINQVSDPKYHTKNGLGEDVERKRNEGYAILQELVRNGRLVIKDSNDGNSLSYADRLIRYYSDRYPDRKIVYVLDNFHKLNDLSGFRDERVRFKEMSKIAKNLATSHHCCVITTIEYKKIEGEPNNNAIAECLTGDTKIFDMATGLSTRIDKVKTGMLVGTLDNETHRITGNLVSKVWDKGIQQIYEVTTNSGRKLKTTINHPFFSENGWEKLSSLQEGSWIGIPNKLLTLNSKDKTNKEMAKFLEYVTKAGDLLPPSYTKKLKDIRKQKNMPSRLSNGFYISNETINRTNAAKYIEETECTQYKKWVESDIYWDKIKSIKKLGKEQVWDLTVENSHNFIANDIFCHNTGQIEYDANLIMHVYNEVHEKGEAAIHSHIYNFENGEGPKVCPRLYIKIGKNKISSFKNKLWFDFYPDSSDFVGVDPKVVWAESNKKKKEVSDSQQDYIIKYRELQTMIEERGWNPNAIYHKFFQFYDWDKEDKEKKDLFSQIQAKA